MGNLDLYENVRSVPESAKKKIEGGNLKDFTDINSMWRIKKLTEMFGVCGDGWIFEDVKEEYKENTDTTEVVFCIDCILRYKKENGEMSSPIIGTGSAMFLEYQNKKIYENGKHVGTEKKLVLDEDYKTKARTSALGRCCKNLGIGADVYWNENKNVKTNQVNTSKNTFQDTNKEDNKSIKQKVNDVVPVISELQVKRLCAIAVANEIDIVRVDTFIKNNYGLGSKNDIPKGKIYNEIIAKIESKMV